MSSAERERAVMKKKESSASSSGRRVFESKKEKKKQRRLILSDSESDDDNRGALSQNKALRDKIGEDTEMDGKSHLGSEVVKEHEEAFSRVCENGVYSKAKDFGSEVRKKKDESSSVSVVVVQDGVSVLNGENLTGNEVAKRAVKIKPSLEDIGKREMGAGLEEEKSDLGFEVVRRAEEMLFVCEVHQNGDKSTSNEEVKVEANDILSSDDDEKKVKGSGIEEIKSVLGSGDFKLAEEALAVSEVHHAMRILSSDDAKEKEMVTCDEAELSVLGSEAVKQAEKPLVASEVHQNGDISTSNEQVEERLKRVSGSEVAENGVKSSMQEPAIKDEVKVESRRGAEEIKVISKRGSISDVMKREEDAEEKFEKYLLTDDKHIVNRLASKQMKVESGIVSLSKVTKKSVEADRMKKTLSGSMVKNNSLEPSNRKEGVKFNSEKLVKSKAVKQQEETDSRKRSSAFSRANQNVCGFVTKQKKSVNQSSMKEERSIEEISTLRSKSITEIEESGTGKKSSAFSMTDKEGDNSSICKQNITDQLTNDVEKMFNTRKVLKSKIVNEREETNSVNRKAAESGSGKKRSRQTLDHETGLKKLRWEHLECREEGSIESGSRNMKKMRPTTDREGGDSSSQKKNNSDQLTSDEEIKIKSRKILKSKAVKKRERAGYVKEVAESGSERKRSKEISNDEISLKSFRSEHVKSRREQRIENDERNMKAKFLRSGEPDCDTEGTFGSKPVESSSRLTDEANQERMEDDMKKEEELETENCRWIQRSTARTLRKLKDNSIPAGSARRDGADVSLHEKGMQVHGKGGVLRAMSSNKKLGRIEGGHSQREETENEKNMVKVKDEFNMGKNSKPGKPNTKDEASEPRGTMKQKVRDQIKGILLDAGWKIDLRPRRGRCYEDAVYVPPTGAAGYWSITKAYNVYVQTNSLLEKGINHKFATVPEDLLQLLTRNVVNKRRRRIDIEDEELEVRNKGKVKKVSKNNDGRILGKNDYKGGKERKKQKIDMDVIGSAARKLHLRVRNKKKRGCALLVRGANQDADTDDDDDYVPYVWKRTILSWMIDLGILSIDGKVRYMNKKQTRALLEGSITRDGIRCGCCSKIISISKFEVHAGSKLHQPYQNVIVDEAGISLLKCQLNAWEKQQESERQGFYKVDIEGDDPNDDTCGICGDGGDLICCDGCPSTFHLNCLGIEMLPAGDWHCTNCSCRYCGTVSDDLPQESGSDISTLLTCLQCEKKYHPDCVLEEDSPHVGSNDSDASFCSISCRKVFRQLQKLIGTKNDLEAGLSWCIIRRFGEDSSRFSCNLLQKTVCNSKIAVAFAVMDECFRPIVDHRSGINLIHNVVYNCGSNISRLSYAGFYTFVLERGDEIIAVASVRIHGTRLAEMPFIGTRNMYRRQGMCRHLLNGIESALYMLNVEKLIIPAISELTETWINVFGFKPLDLSQRQEINSTNMLVFPGTGLLFKQILKRGSSVEHEIDRDEAESVIKHEHMCKAANNGSMISPSSPQPSSPGEEVVHPQQKENGSEVFLHTTDSSDAPPTSEFQDLQNKSLESVADMDLPVKAKVEGHELVSKPKFHMSSPEDPKNKVPCEGTVHGDQIAGNASSPAASGSHAVNDTSVGHYTITKHRDFLEAENESSIPSVNHCVVKHDTPQKATRANISNLLENGDNLLQHTSWDHCNSLSIQSSPLRDCDASSLHVPVGSEDCNADATHLCHCESASKSSSVAEHDGNHDGRYKSISEPRLESLNNDSTLDGCDTTS